MHRLRRMHHEAPRLQRHRPRDIERVPVPVYHVPSSTVTNRSFGCQCGRSIMCGGNLTRMTYIPALSGSPNSVASCTPCPPGLSCHCTSPGAIRIKSGLPAAPPSRRRQARPRRSRRTPKPINGSLSWVPPELSVETYPSKLDRGLLSRRRAQRRRPETIRTPVRPIDRIDSARMPRINSGGAEEGWGWTIQSVVDRF